MEIAVDTSTNTASIALASQGKVIADFSWRTEHNHTVELIPQIVRLLNHENTDIHSIEALTVAIGPGSFNGLRVGLATIKGMAFALNLPVVGVGTLEVIACAHADSDTPIIPVLQAGRSEIAAAQFQSVKGKWTKLANEYITTIDELCEGTKQRSIFCGELEPEQKEEIVQTLGTYADIPIEAPPLTRAGYLGRLGWCRIKEGDFDDSSMLQPLYLRKPSITKPKRRKNDALSNMRT